MFENISSLLPYSEKQTGWLSSFQTYLERTRKTDCAQIEFSQSPDFPISILITTLITANISAVLLSGIKICSNLILVQLSWREYRLTKNTHETFVDSIVYIHDDDIRHVVKSGEWRYNDADLVFIRTNGEGFLRARLALERPRYLYDYKPTPFELAHDQGSNKYPDLMLKQLRVVIFHSPFGIILHRQSENNLIVDGYEMRIVKELSKRMNFTIEYKEIRGADTWGTRLPNGIVVGGVLNQLKFKKAELATCTLWMNLEQWKQIDLSSPVAAVRLTFLVATKYQEDFKRIFQPLAPSVWLLFATLFVLGRIHLLIASAIYKFSKQSSVSVSRTTGHLFLQVCFFLVSTAYSCSILGYLNSPPLPSTIDSVKEMVEHGLYWVRSSKPTFYPPLFFNMKDPYQAELNSRLQVLPLMRDMDEALSKRRAGVVAQRLQERFITLDQAVSPHVARTLLPIKENLATYSVAIGLTKDSPITPHLNRMIGHMKNGGLLDKISRDVRLLWSNNASLTFKSSSDTRLSSSSTKILDLAGLSGAFYFLLTGLLMSTALFLFENIYFIHVRKKIKNTPTC